MVLEHFKTNRSLHTFYTYDDLSRVKWMGDAKLDVFLKGYQETLRSLASTVDDETLTELLLARLRQSKVLSPDIQYFDRLDDNAPERCHRTLLEYIERHLARKRRETMREKVSVGVGRGGTGGDAAPAQDKGKKKPKGKGKGKVKDGEPKPKREKSGGKGSDRKTDEPKSDPPESKKNKGPCYAHLRGECRRGADCRFAHMSEKQIEQLKSALGWSRSPSGDKRTKSPEDADRSKSRGRSREKSQKGKGKGKGRGKVAPVLMPKRGTRRHGSVRSSISCVVAPSCALHSQCNKEECEFSHLDAAGIQSVKRAASIEKSARKGKTDPKAVA